MLSTTYQAVLISEYETLIEKYMLQGIEGAVLA